MAAEYSARERMSEKISEFLGELNDNLDWQQWIRSKIHHTLFFDDDVSPSQMARREFRFPKHLQSEHDVIMSYLELLDTANALQDVEWYFRRYPFSRTPVSKAKHLTYCCEMYFNRFYQFRERLKKLSQALKAASPALNLDFGSFIKTFDKKFAHEIKARNRVHHHEAFDEIGIARIMLLETTSDPEPLKHLRDEVLTLYRKASKNWASRAKRRSSELNLFVEATAAALLGACPFLNDGPDG